DAPEVEHFELRLDAGGGDPVGHLGDMAGRVEEDMRAEIEAADVEAADFRLQRLDMRDARRRPRDRRTGAELARLLRAKHDARPRPGGEVDDDVAARLADAVDDLGIERVVHARRAG